MRTDNGPEFTCRAFIAWAQAHDVRHILIQPGRPMQNGYIESFNGKFRDECLNEHWFQTLMQARSEIATWRTDPKFCAAAWLPCRSLLVAPALCTLQHSRRASVNVT
ncbi:UNVERIFIED_ORG: hypothetical protein HNP28_002519 [Comamonas terrigena]